MPLVRPSLSSSSFYLIGPQIDDFAKLLLKFGQQILSQNLCVVFDGRIRETNLKSQISKRLIQVLRHKLEQRKTVKLPRTNSGGL